MMSAKKTSTNDWFLEDTTREDFEKLSGEERLRELMAHELKRLSGVELEARVEEITRGADEFVKKLRFSRAWEGARRHGGSPNR